MPHVHTLASALAGAAIAIWIDGVLLTGGAQWKTQKLTV